MKSVFELWNSKVKKLRQDEAVYKHVEGVEAAEVQQGREDVKQAPTDVDEISIESEEECEHSELVLKPGRSHRRWGRSLSRRRSRRIFSCRINQRSFSR